MTSPTASRILAARILSAFIWNREARHAFRNALLRDYDQEIKRLKAEKAALREQLARQQETLRGIDDRLFAAAEKSASEMRGLNAKNQALAEKIRELGATVQELRVKISPPPKPYRIEGKDNRVIIVEEDGRERLLGRDERIPGLAISICGDDNEIKVHKSCRLAGNTIQIGVVSSGSRNCGARIEILENATFQGMYVRCVSGENQRLRFGRGSRIWGGSIILDETSACFIGDDCNCSNEIRIWGSDGHAILDKNNPEKILNEIQGPIVVGDHLWLGQSVRLQKNARVPANTIIAAGSIVTKAFEEEYTILAGVPAKVIKRGVMREPQTLSPYLLKKSRKADAHG